ncbi:hypothetical protein HK28_03110 [Acetobacter sp. DsW_063]|nr:hypothetical protein HK28_03110 [Acetobacter sp. DsW_063]
MCWLSRLSTSPHASRPAARGDPEAVAQVVEAVTAVDRAAEAATVEEDKGVARVAATAAPTGRRLLIRRRIYNCVGPALSRDHAVARCLTGASSHAC